jgi:hypothetical protein
MDETRAEITSIGTATDGNPQLIACQCVQIRIDRRRGDHVVRVRAQRLTADALAGRGVDAAGADGKLFGSHGQLKSEERQCDPRYRDAGDSARR